MHDEQCIGGDTWCLFEGGMRRMSMGMFVWIDHGQSTTAHRASEDTARRVDGEEILFHIRRATPNCGRTTGRRRTMHMPERMRTEEERQQTHERHHTRQKDKHQIENEQSIGKGREEKFERIDQIRTLTHERHDHEEETHHQRTMESNREIGAIIETRQTNQLKEKGEWNDDDGGTEKDLTSFDC